MMFVCGEGIGHKTNTGVKGRVIVCDLSGLNKVGTVKYLGSTQKEKLVTYYD